MAISVYIVILFSAKKYGRLLGFIFLIGSLFKFAVYFAIIQPVLHNNDLLNRTGFFIFFIPYCLSLIVETMALVKLLRELE